MDPQKDLMQRFLRELHDPQHPEPPKMTKKNKEWHKQLPNGKGLQLVNKHFIIVFDYKDRLKIDQFEDRLSVLKEDIDHNPYDQA